ncbi:MAG: hypothetical protein H5T72_03325 [Actinobacteria bacterium]|nr:hypothetical protein [Actinomycetota bacterium]
MFALAVVLSALTVVILGVVLACLWVKRLRDQALAELARRTEGEEVYALEGCNFLGKLSGGYAQIRGNGLLALTDRGIHFRMLFPRRCLFIPLGSVTEVSDPRSFLGKWKGKELLRVDFTDQEGKADACAWLVRSPAWWSGSLRSLLSGEGPPPAP